MYVVTTATSIDNADLPYPADRNGQSAWQPFMGSLEPVVRDDEDLTTRAPDSRDSHAPRQLPSYDQQMASQNLATFPLRNTSDAIRLLDQDQPPMGSEQSGEADVLSADSCSPDFFLLREGLIDEANLFRLFHFYLGSLHPIMPLIPYERIPTTSEQILTMAGQAPHFMAAILVVATGLLGEYTRHHHLWQRVERLFAQLAITGTNESLEMIEGLLLLSEYPPNMGHSTGLRFEDRMCWMTVGTAVRLGYLLGLEQLVMQPDDVEEKFSDDRARGKIVWSYCFCLDRQISIRVGKPFWHRSPGMTIQHMHFDPADDFPQMRQIEGLQDDYAAYLQCLMHITQILSNAHDLLYPSKSHSFAIAKSEHYYKHIDEFTEALSAFRNRWQKKPWRTYPINECVWISFHHLRLYIYSFSLQGHMIRAEHCNDGRRPLDYFPTGLMGSVDARFIIEAMNAAADVLRLAMGRFQPSGALGYLPLRFFLFFSHAGVFLLKAAVIVPLPPSQKRAILHLIRAIIRCMSMASSDTRHPAVRNSSALDGLLRRIYRDHDMQTPTATYPSSPVMAPAGHIAHSTESVSGSKSRPNDTDLPTFLGSRESPFVAERPLQELAADIDAIFGLEPGNSDMTGPLTTDHTSNELPTIVPGSDVFASLFNYDDRTFWEGFTPMTLD